MEYPFKDLLPLDEVLEREGYYKDWTHLDPKVFYSLTQISEYIKTKGFGVDVRLLIAQLAEHFGLKTTQVVNLANLLQQKFTNLEGITQSFTSDINSLVEQMEADKNAVIANVTVDSEVILARGEDETLGERLDKMSSKVNDLQDVSVKDFGAIGNGINDDGQALLEAHQYANSVGVKVTYPKGTYYIGDVGIIPVETDVDATKAKFLVDPSFYPDSSLFRIKSKHASYSIDESTVQQITVKKTTNHIPELAGHGDCVVEFKNDNKRVYMRYGATQNDGMSQSDIVVMDDLGNLYNDIKWDFDEITGIEIYPIDLKTITFQVGEWEYINNVERTGYIQRGVYITRSNTRVSIGDESLRPLSALGSYSGVISTSVCANVEIFDTKLETKPYIDRGVYGFQVQNVVNLTINNVTAKRIPSNIPDWSIMGGNKLKDVLIINSTLNNVDSHTGSHNITIKNSHIGRRGILVTGSGLLHVENVSVNMSRTVITLRDDYGSTWDGSIVLKNVKHKLPPEATTSAIIEGTPRFDWDFGYKCHLGKSVDIDGYHLYDTPAVTDGVGVGVEMSTSQPVNTNPYYFPDVVSIKNVTTESGRKIFRAFRVNELMHLSANKTGFWSREGDYNVFNHNSEVRLGTGDWRYDNDITGLSSPITSLYSNGNDMYTPHKVYPLVILDSIDQVYINCLAMAFKYKINNSTVRYIAGNNGGGGRSYYDITNSIIDTRSNSQTHFRNQIYNVELHNCVIKPPRKEDGSMITSASAISNAHAFLLFGTKYPEAISINSTTYNCRFSQDYPINAFASSLAIYGLKPLELPQGGGIIFRISGTTSERPTDYNLANPIPQGFMYFDTTLNKPVFRSGGAWRDAYGNVV